MMNLFLFFQWFWRFNELGLMEMFPAKIKNFWYGLPQNFSNVDAVYENQMDQKIYFFKGQYDYRIV